MPKFKVVGTAHASFVITVDASDEDRATEKAEKAIVDAIEFNAPDRCAFDVDVSVRESTAE